MAQSIDTLVPVIATSQGFISTSTDHSFEYSGSRCRLNKSKTSRKAEGWCPAINDKNQYLMVGCEVPRTFIAVAIQGLGLDDAFIQSYKVRYSLDGINWNEYRGGAGISGCYDQQEIQTYFFKTPIRARSIAIVPLEWKNKIGLRCEFYSEPVVSTFTQIGQVNSGTNTGLSSGVDVREIIVPVVFDVPFSKKPRVAICFDMIDSDSNDAQTRLEVYPINIKNTGFDCVFKTWWLSRAWTLRADYIATLHE